MTSSVIFLSPPVINLHRTNIWLRTLKVYERVNPPLMAGRGEYWGGMWLGELNLYVIGRFLTHWALQPLNPQLLWSCMLADRPCAVIPQAWSYLYMFLYSWRAWLDMWKGTGMNEESLLYSILLPYMQWTFAFLFRAKLIRRSFIGIIVSVFLYAPRESLQEAILAELTSSFATTPCASCMCGCATARMTAGTTRTRILTCVVGAFLLTFKKTHKKSEVIQEVKLLQVPEYCCCGILLFSNFECWDRRESSKEDFIQWCKLCMPCNSTQKSYKQMRMEHLMVNLHWIKYANRTEWNLYKGVEI